MQLYALALLLVCVVAIVLSTGPSRYIPGQVRASEVGGQVAIRDRFPYVCKIKTSDGDQGSGFLVSSTVVVTAAHVVFSNGHVIDPRQCIVFIGQGDVLAGDGRVEQRKITKISYPSSYVQKSSEYGVFPDYALLTLVSPSTKAPVRIATPATMPSVGSVVLSLGYGLSKRPDQGFVLPGVLMSNQLVVRLITPTAISCIGHRYSNGYSSICYGDSGGPLIVPGSSAREDMVVAVATSVPKLSYKGKTMTCDGYSFFTRADTIRFRGLQSVAIA